MYPELNSSLLYTCCSRECVSAHVNRLMDTHVWSVYGFQFPRRRTTDFFWMINQHHLPTQSKQTLKDVCVCVCALDEFNVTHSCHKHETKEPVLVFCGKFSKKHPHFFIFRKDFGLYVSSLKDSNNYDACKTLSWC